MLFSCFLGFVAFHGCCCCFQCYKILMSKASSYSSTHFHYSAELIFSSWYGCSLGQLQTYMDINSLRIKTCFLTSSEFSSFLFFCKFPFIICLSLLVVNLHFMLFMILEIAHYGKSYVINDTWDCVLGKNGHHVPQPDCFQGPWVWCISMGLVWRKTPTLPISAWKMLQTGAMSMPWATSSLSSTSASCTPRLLTWLASELLLLSGWVTVVLWVKGLCC